MAPEEPNLLPLKVPLRVPLFLTPPKQISFAPARAPRRLAETVRVAKTCPRLLAESHYDPPLHWLQPLSLQQPSFSPKEAAMTLSLL